MQSVIYIMNVLDNPRIEVSILILSEDDIKNIILQNKDLAKKVLSEVE